ncbi:MAG TPA: hypothetical protein VGQ21_19855, partial [Thermoanaerobaculia bacterium]|nr:hypothetical protein [Thermoanaerobaculia bacterium]
MTHKKAIAGFAFFLLTVSVAFAQNTAWPGPTATANVGIGVASTDAKLQVAGGSAFISGDSGFLASGGAGLALKYNTAGAQLFGYDYSAGAPKNLILQSPGGNVAIGTTTASARLQVAGSAFIAGDSGALSSASGSGLGLKYTTAGAEVYGYNYSTMSPVSLLLQHFGGNVGIGVDVPLSAFHLSRGVASTTDYLMRLDNNAVAGNDPAMIITYTGGKSLLSLAGTNGGALATDGTLYFATGSDLNVN